MCYFRNIPLLFFCAYFLPPQQDSKSFRELYSRYVFAFMMYYDLNYILFYFISSLIRREAWAPGHFWFIWGIKVGLIDYSDIRRVQSEMTFLFSDTIIFNQKKKKRTKNLIFRAIFSRDWDVNWRQVELVKYKASISLIELALQNYSLWEFGEGRIRGRTSDMVLIKH